MYCLALTACVLIETPASVLFTRKSARQLVLFVKCCFLSQSAPRVSEGSAAPLLCANVVYESMENEKAAHINLSDFADVSIHHSS